MIQRRIGRKEYSVYAFDVESHNDAESLKNKKTGIWLASFINDDSKPEDEENYFYDLDSVFAKWKELTHREAKRNHHDGKGFGRPKNILIYIWNAAFEWSFLLPWLIGHGFECKQKIEDSDSNCFSSVTTKTCSSVWSAEIKFEKTGGRVVIRDLCKIMTGTLRSAAKSLGLATQKGVIDYRKNRLHGYKPTEKEKLYNFKDTEIIIEILKIMDQRNDLEFWQSVSAASYSCKKMVRAAWPNARRVMNVYRQRFPHLPPDQTEFLRKSVAGGLTYAPPLFQFKDIHEKIGHIDFHQSHPSRMASMHNERFAYGEGVWGKGKPVKSWWKIACCHVKVSYSAVRLHSVIKLINTEAVQDFELWVWDFELETMKKAYCDLEIEYIDYLEFKAGRLPFADYFKENFRIRLEAKKKGDLFEVAHRKLLNNSAYGKFLEKGHEVFYANCVSVDGRIDSLEIPVDDAPLDGSFTYIPTGSLTAAYSRCALIEAGLKIGWQYIAYMDTDSLFFVENETTMRNVKKLEINSKLGSFGWEDVDENGETTITCAQFACPKRYKYLSAGVPVVKMAGATRPDLDPVDLSEIIDERDMVIDEDGNEIRPARKLSYGEINIIDGTFFSHGRTRVEGGTIITDKAKVLQVQGKYYSTYLANRG